MDRVAIPMRDIESFAAGKLRAKRLHGRRPDLGKKIADLTALEICMVGYWPDETEILQKTSNLRGSALGARRDVVPRGRKPRPPSGATRRETLFTNT